MRSRGPRRAVVFGEAIVDVYPDITTVGGAPVHVAAQLAATGWQVDLISRVGADRAGGKVVAALGSMGISTALVEMDHDLPTGRVEILPQGAFRVDHPSAYDEIDGPPSLHDHVLFYYGTLAARAAISRATLLRLIAASRGLRVLDVNLRSPHFSRSVLAALVSRAQLLKMTAWEMFHVAGLLGIPASPQAFFRATRSLSLLCVTRGREGAELFSSTGDRWEAPAPRVDVVDRVGAGDAFVARLAGALAAGYSEEAALQAAIAAAGDVLGRYGALPGRRGPIV